MARMDRPPSPAREEDAGLALPFWGLLAFAFWSPVSIAGANIAWVAALLLWALRRLREPGGAAGLPRRTSLDPGLALLALASLLSLCVSLDPLASLREIRCLGLMAVYYLFAWNAPTRRHARILLSVWFAVSAAAAAYGAVEYFSGWDALGHYDPRTNKIGGFFSMHLTFSEYLLLALCMCAGVLLWDRPRAGRGRAFLWAAFGIILFGFLLARAKGATLGLLAGMGVIGALRGRRTLAVMAAAALAPLALLAAWNAPLLCEHFLATFLVDTDTAAGYVHSNTQRLFMWWTGFRLSLGHLLNGVGLHAVGAVYPAFRHPDALVPNQWHLHSNFVHLGVTRGLLGLAGFLYIFLLAARGGLARFRDAASGPWERGLAAGALGACAGFLVSGLTEYSWGDSEVLMALYMVLGLSVSGPPGPSPSLPAGKGAPGAAPAAGGRESPAWAKASFAGLLGLVCLTGLLCPHPSAAPGPRALQAVLGIVLAATAWAPALFSPDTPGRNRGQGRCGPAVRLAARLAPAVPEPVRRLLEPWLLPPRGAVLAACIVTFAGYGFTRRAWEGLDPAAGAAGFSGPAVWLPACLALAVLLLLFLRRRPPGGWARVDAALLGAAALWWGLALGTDVLLRLASGGRGPPWGLFPGVSLLCLFAASLYLAARFLHARGPLAAGAQCVLGLWMVLDALRG